MNSKRQILAILFIATSITFSVAQKKENIWKDEIAKFAAQDYDAMPEEGGIVFTGSSSIRGWRSVGEDFPERNVINRGFGGSEFKDILYYFEELICKYNPRQVVIYSGDNDIASGKSPELVFEIFKTIAEKLKSEQPDTELVILAIKPSIARWNLWEKMSETNQMIKEYADRQEHVVFVDVATPMLGSNGKPRLEIFIGDGLHFTPEGYSLWAEIVKPYLIETDNND